MSLAIQPASHYPFQENGCYGAAAPMPTREFNPENDMSLFHEYQQEQMTRFTPTDIVHMLEQEKVRADQGMSKAKAREDSWQRLYYNDLKQFNKPGPDGVKPTYSTSATLTEDILVGYFDQFTDSETGEKQDILHIILLLRETERREEWVLPGQRDRSYDERSPQICIEDANLALVEKEIHISQSDVAYQFPLGFFDDRLREERFRGCGMLSFVLLKRRPRIEEGRMIALPLNVLVQLAQREIKISPFSNSPELAKGMGRNHDSIILGVIKTASFFHTMNKIKISQAKFRQSGVWPPLPHIVPGTECFVCFDVLVGATQICPTGHKGSTVCRLCIETLQLCPICRKPVDPRPNMDLEEVVQTLNPVEYDRRCKELAENGHQIDRPVNWTTDPAFIGRNIIYMAN